MLIGASGVALIGSVLIALFVAVFIPQVTDGTAPPGPLPGTRTYTLEELDKAQEEAKARLKQRMAEESNKSPRQHFLQIQAPALWATWLPWFLLPVTLRLHRAIEALLVLALPALIVACGIAAPGHLISFSGALVLGMATAHLLRKRPDPTRAT